MTILTPIASLLFLAWSAPWLAADSSARLDALAGKVTAAKRTHEGSVEGETDSPVHGEEEVEIPFDQLPVFETVVTADRSEERAFESIRAIETMDAERIERALPASVSEAIRDLPGLHLQETNRGAGSPILRGRVGPDNLIVVDGFRFNTSTFRTGPNQYLATIDLDAVDRIEVVRGPSSVLYGNGALGGVVHVLTRTPSPTHGPPAVSANARGSLASEDRSGGMGARFSAGAGPVAALGGASFASFGDLRAGGGFVQPHTGYERRGWHAALVYEPGADWTVRATHLGSMIRNAGRADQIGRGDLRFYDNTDHLTHLSAGWRGFGLIREVRAGILLHRMVEAQRRFICEPGTGIERCLGLDDSVIAVMRRGEDSVTSLGAEVSARASLIDRRVELLAGGDAYRDTVDSSAERADSGTGFVFEPLPRGSFSLGSSYMTLGSFVHARGVLVDRGPGEAKLRAEAGGRLSSFMGDAPDVPGLGEVSYRYNGAVGSGGLQYYRPGVYNLYGSFMQGFRAPNLQETTVLGSTGSKFEIPNDDLRPERSMTFELGGRLQVGPALLQTAVYRSYLVDAIDEEPALWQGDTHVGGAPVVRRVNAASGIYDGVEGGASLWLGSFKLQGAATWTRGDLRDGDGLSHPARRVPPLFGTISAGYYHPADRYHVELGLRWAMRQDRLHPSDMVDTRICGLGDYRDELDPDCRGTPGYAVLDLRAGAKINDWSRVVLVAGNLFDHRYRTHGSGVDAPGLGVRGMVEVSY